MHLVGRTVAEADLVHVLVALLAAHVHDARTVGHVHVLAPNDNAPGTGEHVEVVDSVGNLVGVAAVQHLQRVAAPVAETDADDGVVVAESGAVHADGAVHRSREPVAERDVHGILEHGPEEDGVGAVTLDNEPEHLLVVQVGALHVAFLQSRLVFLGRELVFQARGVYDAVRVLLALVGEPHLGLFHVRGGEVADPGDDALASVTVFRVVAHLEADSAGLVEDHAVVFRVPEDAGRVLVGTAVAARVAEFRRHAYVSVGLVVVPVRTVVRHYRHEDLEDVPVKDVLERLGVLRDGEDTPPVEHLEHYGPRRDTCLSGANASLQDEQRFIVALDEVELESGHRGIDTEILRAVVILRFPFGVVPSPLYLSATWHLPASPSGS